MKRFISILFAVSMIFALVGCGKERRAVIQLTLSTEDSEAILRAAGITLPDAEEAAGANSVVKWFGWGDPFQNYDENEIVNTGYWTFKKKYSGTIDYIETDYFQWSENLAALIIGGTPPDVMTGGYSFPMGAIKGTVQPVDAWIDYDNPLWSPMKDLADNFTLGGNHYFICIETKPSNVTVYNRRVIDDFGYDDPAELYWNDEWTWNVFYDMCVGFSDPDQDRFALDGYAFAGMFIEATGQQLLQRNPDGTFYSNIDSPEIERGQNYLYDLLKNDCTYGRGTWALRNNATFGSGLKDGLCLFYVIGESFFTDTVENIESIWGDITNGEVMFAPLPRDENGDGIYYLASNFDDIKGSMVIINNAPNPEGVALLASCIRFKAIDPVVIQIDKKQLREIYHWNDDMIEMSEECQRIAQAHFITGVGGALPDNLQSVLNTFSDSIIRGGSNPSTWAQLKEANGDSFEYYIEELNNIIKENGG